MKTTKISDYFKPSKSKSYQFIDNKSKSIDANKNNNNNSNTNSNTNSEAKFRLPKLLSKEQRKILEESLFRAIQVKNVVFDDNLTFPHKDCPKSFNDSSREIGIQKISEYNKQIYYKFKEKSQKAEYAPIEIVDHEIQVIIFYLYL